MLRSIKSPIEHLRSNMKKRPKTQHTRKTSRPYPCYDPDGYIYMACRRPMALYGYMYMGIRMSAYRIVYRIPSKETI